MATVDSGPSARTGNNFNFEMKYQVVLWARNDETGACLSILGDPKYYYTLKSQGASFWFYDNQDMLPKSIIPSSRKLVLPSEESLAHPPSPSTANKSSIDNDWDNASFATQPPPILLESFLF